MGGRVCEEEGSRRGVEVFEWRVEGGKTRFARRNEKNAGQKLVSAKAGAASRIEVSANLFAAEMSPWDESF